MDALAELSLFFFPFCFRLFPPLLLMLLSCFAVNVDEVFGVCDLDVCLFCPFLVLFPGVPLAPPPLATEGVDVLLVGGVVVGIGDGVR